MCVCVYINLFCAMLALIKRLMVYNILFISQLRKLFPFFFLPSPSLSFPLPSPSLSFPLPSPSSFLSSHFTYSLCISPTVLWQSSPCEASGCHPPFWHSCGSSGSGRPFKGQEGQNHHPGPARTTPPARQGRESPPG